jgi:hypothetical protein
MDERFEAAPIGILQAGHDGVVTAVNDRAASLLAADRAGIRGAPIEDVFPASVENTVPEVFRNTDPEPRTVEEYYPEIDQWFEVSVVPGDEQATVYLQDVTERYRNSRRVERLRDDLDRLIVTNQLISDILGELVNASSREEIAATICDRLGRTDLYEFAWVGERELGGGDLVVRASSGDTGRTLEELRGCLAEGTALPEQRAIDEGTVQTVQPLGEVSAVPESMRRAAFADGLQSLLAVPLTYGSTVYGVVGIYAAKQDAFSERERASFSTVGEMAGFAINASRNRSLLLSDTVVELTLELTDPDAPLVVAATETGGELSLDGVVPQGSELFCYFAVTDASPSAVSEALEANAGVAEVRVIGEYETGGSLEVELDEETPLGRLTAQGVTIKQAEVGDGTGEFQVELSPETDVRRIAESVTRNYDGSVVAKRQYERELTRPREFREELRDRLTEKQENALRTAFFADYFESPRGSTAEQVAETLGITGPTLLHHLRAGQRKLLSQFFDTPSEPRN